MRRIAVILMIASALSACGDDVLDPTVAPPPTVGTTIAPTTLPATTVAPTTTTTAPTTTTTTAAPTTTTTAAPTTTTTLPWGPVAPDCINGWISPEPGSELWNTGLGYLGVGPFGVVVDAADFVVDEMRYFVGPEDPNFHLTRDVERWYIKGYVISDPLHRSRWLARRANVGAGLAWVAGYDSTGWGPNTWIECYDSDRTNGYYTDFCVPGAEIDAIPISCAAFPPGGWNYGDCHGLPPEVLGCVAGT